MACCGNCYFGGKSVGGRGNITSPFVIIAESPSAMEAATQKTFIGPPGQLLADALKSLMPEGCPQPYMMYAFNCVAKQKDPKKLMAATKACEARVKAELALHPRKVILTLGNAALWSTTGDYSLKVTQRRGERFKSDLASEGIVCAVHPAFLLRGGGSIQQFRRDISVALELLTGKAITGIKESQMQAKARFSPSEYTVVSKQSQIDKIVNDLRSGKFPIAGADLETDGFNPKQRIINIPSYYGVGILCMGLCYEPGHTWVIPGEWLTNDIFKNDILFAWHNGKFDISWLREYGYSWARVDEDTMLMSYCLNEQGGIHDLEQVGSDWLQATNYKNILDEYLPSAKHSYAVIPKDILYKYQAIDANLTYNLAITLREHLNSDSKLRRVYEQILLPGSEFLSNVERKGFYVDQNKVRENEERLSFECNMIETEFKSIAFDYGFSGINIRSSKQMKKFLYGTLKLAHPNESTDKKALEKLPNHPAVLSLKKYRKVHKLYSTYVKPIWDKLDDESRLHTTFKLHGTTTGRLSSNKPNIQNIPRDKLLRGMFAAPDGRMLLEVDLAQAELRMLACLSGDQVMIDIFNSGISLHDEVAMYLFGKDFGKEQKMIAKNINFGIVYGISAAGLKEQVEIGGAMLGATMRVTIQEAQAWIDGWYARFPDAANFINRCRQAPILGQTLVSAFGRKRRFSMSNRESIHNAQNEAANFPEQSAAHDVTLLSGIQLGPELADDYDGYIVNEVHDCLITEIPNNMAYIAPAALHIIKTMEEIPRKWGLTEVPFKAEAEVGKNWGYGKNFHPEQYLTGYEGVTYEESGI